ncbi:sigma-70 family RNA polymerase sigma factor [Paenibacillus sacheonensis]|uniref:Sigma-70 family RNA polymerase sigma factor n=1 Tax=Paenibacillus sacheonensis TaxID=742054 RepID=A0A7X5C0A1_9BACL|nr:RNA polymerase sigma-70 factor (ECF subfamily) [Paenibacillus sacheonensis]NBC71356.1 sigma-70 family RNA polymerase sigma factor [Paenibacillus sacheonensis]
MNHRELFHGLYAAHSKQLFSFLLGRTNDRELAADLLQDVYLRAWNRRESVDRIAPAERIYWLFSVAANRLKDEYRRTANQKKAEERLRAAPADGEGDLSGVVAGRERVRELEARMNDLPDELRCILTMKVLGELNSVQIGAILQQPPGTIRYKILQARRLLAEQLKLLETVPTGEKGDLHARRR